jgi:hypothetical protein
MLQKNKEITRCDIHILAGILVFLLFTPSYHLRWDCTLLQHKHGQIEQSKTRNSNCESLRRNCAKLCHSDHSANTVVCYGTIAQNYAAVSAALTLCFVTVQLRAVAPQMATARSCAAMDQKHVTWEVSIRFSISEINITAFIMYASEMERVQTNEMSFFSYISE